MDLATRFFSRPSLVFAAAIVFRVILLIYGRWQDANSPMKYTDIDYLVFTDAARFVSEGRSPYDRATYRYTPLLAWLLYPTSFGGYWFEFGKVLFAAGDIVTGWLIMLILQTKGIDQTRAMKYASIWLLNPMVANISTRGSSEGLVAVIVVALLWAAMTRRHILAGALLGLGVHVKIYPFIYAASLFWWLDSNIVGSWDYRGSRPFGPLTTFFTSGRVKLAAVSFVVFTMLNVYNSHWYGKPFANNTYYYHFARIDHRHNFSIYNTVLHLSSAQGGDASGLHLKELAFIPQIFLSVVALPILLAKKDVASTMLAQTFAFVTFNKVCTSQYFLWYMVFLPFYLPGSSLLRNPRLGFTALIAWIAGQGLWLQQGFELEFLGKSTFVPGLWCASAVFFLINCWILGIIVSDIRATDSPETKAKVEVKKNK